MRYSINYLTKNAIQDEKTITLPNGVVVQKEIDCDNIRFPKYNKQRTYRQLVHFHANKSTPRDIEFYLPWVTDVARKMLNDQLETLTLEDLVQSGNEGLVRAWNNMNWDVINEIKEEEQQAAIWAFLQARIKGQIQDEIYRSDSFIKIPQRQIKKATSQMTGVEKIYVSLFPKFFDEEMELFDETYSSWDNERLYEFLMDLLYNHVPNSTHRSILTMSFGLDTWDNKPVSRKKIAEKFNLSEGAVKNARERVLRMIINNEEIQNKIKIYLEN